VGFAFSFCCFILFFGGAVDQIQGHGHATQAYHYRWATSPEPIASFIKFYWSTTEAG
jgi:hypothetical protein